MDVNIFSYTDFRVYLNDYFEYYKCLDKKFSKRYYSLKLGIKSSGFISDVIKGRRNLSAKNIQQCNTVLHKTQDVRDYFSALVAYNQAKDLNEQRINYNKLLHCKNINMEILDRDQYKFYTEWYHTAIREALFYFKLTDNFRELAKTLTPSITEEQARKSIELLEKLNLIRKNNDGYYELTNDSITTGKIRKTIEIETFQQKMTHMAEEALNKLPPNQRDFSTLSMSLSDEGYEKLQKVLAKTRKDLLKIAQSDNGENRVYHVNLQAFPLTKRDS